MWWFTSIIPALGRPRQKDHELEVSMGYMWDGVSKNQGFGVLFSGTSLVQQAKVPLACLQLTPQLCTCKQPAPIATSVPAFGHSLFLWFKLSPWFVNLQVISAAMNILAASLHTTGSGFQHCHPYSQATKCKAYLRTPTALATYMSLPQFMPPRTHTSANVTDFSCLIWDSSSPSDMEPPHTTTFAVLPTRPSAILLPNVPHSFRHLSHSSEDLYLPKSVHKV
jgi:hypothetical protein